MHFIVSGPRTHLPGRVISSAEIPSIKHNPWGWNASKILLWIPLIKISGCRCLFLPSSCAEVAGGSQGHLVCPHPLTIFKDQSHTRKVLLLVASGIFFLWKPFHTFHSLLSLVPPRLSQCLFHKSACVFENYLSEWKHCHTVHTQTWFQGEFFCV